MYRLVLLFSVLLFCFCQKQPTVGTFSDDLTFLEQHTGIVLLKDAEEKGMLIVAPGWQGRVMTSTAGGMNGTSYGWINRELIASGEIRKHINAFGGEDRFWLGPEGGQFALYFAPGVPFELEHWQVPAALDTEPFEVRSNDDRSVTLGRAMSLTNYSGTEFKLEVERTVRVVPVHAFMAEKGYSLPENLSAIAYESVNDVSNSGDQRWEKSGGCPSIWILGMYNASPKTTVIIPYVQGSVDSLGPVVNDRYFGKIGPDRLNISDDIVYFKADAGKRSKIGLTPQRSTSILGSYNAEQGILTVVFYNKPEEATDFVNSMWEIQEDPYSGDVVNSYNDGPAAPGGDQLGQFYELETSSPALALDPGETYRHVHMTLHIEGTEVDLEPLVRSMFGIGISDITNVF
jgi:hypothetical protein